MVIGFLVALPLWIICQIFLRDTTGPFVFHWPDLLYFAWPIIFVKKIPFAKLPFRFFLQSSALLVLDYLISQSVNLVLLVSVGLCLAFWIGVFLKYSYICFKQWSFLKALGLSTLAWLLIALAFPPLPLGLGIGVFMAPWLWTLNKLNRKQGAVLTFWSSIPYNALMYYWIYNVVKVGPAVAILSGLFLMIAYLSTYNVLGAWLYQSLYHKKLKWIFPLAWAGLEVLRTKGEMAFPWGHIGYAYGQFDTFIQPTAFIGVFGISALIVFSNQSLLEFIETKKTSLVLPVFAIPLVLFSWGFVILQNATPPDKFAKLALIQPNISQTDKWDRKYYYKVIDKTWSMIENYSPSDSIDLIVLPETSIPNFANRVPGLLHKYKRKAETAHLEFFLGVLDTDNKGPAPKGKRYFNTGRWIRSTTDTDSVYNKIFLVPFSERLPFDGILPIINFLDFGEGDFTPGTSIPIYETNGFKWTPNICYETIFPFFMRDQIKLGSQLVVNITNDGWFGASTQPWQHLNLVRYRAAENAMPVARNTNTGVTAFIDSYGRISQHTDIMVEANLVAKIGLKNRKTFYSNWGGVIEGTLFVFFLTLVLWLSVPYGKGLTIFKQ